MKLKIKFKDLLIQLRVILYSLSFKIFVILVLTIIFSTFVIFVSEKGKNPSIKNFFDAFWYIMITFSTVGYGDIIPSTQFGKIIGLLVIVIGVILVAIATGQLASILVEQQLRKGRGLMKLRRISNHIVICGWKNDFMSFLYELLETNPDISPSDIVLVNNENPEVMQTVLADPVLSKVNYIHGEYFDENILRRAKIEKASKVLVLADDTGRYSTSEIDSKTVMTVLTIESINKSVYISAEIFDIKFQKYLERSHCDEIILTKEFSKKLIINSTKGNGFSHIIEELVSPKKDTVLLIEDIPVRFVGKKYKELFEYFHENRKLLLGLLEYTGNFYLRKKEAIKEAQKTPDISTLVENLKSIKKMRGNEPVLNPDPEYIIKKNTKAILFGKKKIKEVENVR